MENENANIFGIMLQIKLQKETNMTRQREAQENGIKLSSMNFEILEICLAS